MAIQNRIQRKYNNLLESTNKVNTINFNSNIHEKTELETEFCVYNDDNDIDTDNMGWSTWSV